MASVRSFVAVLLPEAVRVRMAAVATELRRDLDGVAWVRVESLHVTLRFLGGLEESMLGRVEEALGAAGAATAPFGLALGGLGAFPTARAPRVIWVGVRAGVEAVSGLHGRLEAALLARADLVPERRPFHPHVTLGRVREGRRRVGDIGRLLAGHALPLGDVTVDAIALMGSELDPTGARHRVLARVPLLGSD